jgi:hypothetical protein
MQELNDRRRNTSVILRPLNLHWMRGAIDDTNDLCAHADIEFRIGADVLIDDANGKGLTISAAALFLLRTLTRPHSNQAPVGDQLFPCCGFDMFDLPDHDGVVILGCGHGVNFEVSLSVGGGPVIRSDDGREWPLEWHEWRDAVFGFADSVSAFYASCSPKQASDDKLARGFRKYASEWACRRGVPFGGRIGDGT